MLLAFDIGNTSITVGLFRGKRLVSTGRIPTHDSYPLPLKKLLRRFRVSSSSIERVIVSSVVPKATVSLKKALAALRLAPLVVGQNIQAPVLNRYKVPGQV